MANLGKQIVKSAKLCDTRLMEGQWQAKFEESEPHWLHKQPSFIFSLLPANIVSCISFPFYICSWYSPGAASE